MWCSTCENLWIHALNYLCKTEIDEAKVICFLGVQTDTISESSYGNMSAHKKFQLKTQN